MRDHRPGRRLGPAFGALVGLAVAGASASTSAAPFAGAREPVAATAPVEGPQPDPAGSAGAEALAAGPSATPDAGAVRAAAPPPTSPPRIDGTYFGGGLRGGVSIPRLRTIDPGGAFAGGGGEVLIGQMVLPWFGLGFGAGGDFGVSERDGVAQQLAQGGLELHLTFVPLPQRTWTIRGGLGFGGGAVTEEGRSGRDGYGGALFSVASRYEFFPLAPRRRANRAGGWALGPEVAWRIFTPAAPGRPLSNTLSIGLTSVFYFGT